MSRIRMACVCALVAVVAGPAGASLIGTEVDCRAFVGAVACDRTTATVGDGAEFAVLGDGFAFPLLEVDLEAESIRLTGSPGQSFTIPPSQTAILDIRGLDWGETEGSLVGFDLSLDDGISGLAVSLPQNFPGAIRIDLSNASWESLATATIALDVRHDVIPPAVPEPTGAIVFALGIGLVALRTRRRSH